ncbi:restriction endonuclease [Actinomadura darangshiensis]|uniref:Restriction endonuclease n=1 Tax=Actinomadura darangshiensis TaxID=705336 RepID=A0A4R5BJS2_9ACTN|nr:AAA family ATPase [Actinomadura darangshiensis]TDD85889.1 restriction endonuclease [Actinomadura darangshiensis]
MGTGLSVTTNETPDGRHIVHYDGQSFELTSFSGEVICPASDGTALHHSRTCNHMAGYEDGWKIYPDQGGDLWLRLLEAAPADDVRGRQAFAEAAGLRNGAGRPISKLCQTCTLVPLSSVGGITTPAKPLSKALAEFDRTALAARVAEAESEVSQVTRDFPLDAWPTMSLERYALGTDVYKQSFSYRMEYGTRSLCDIRGRTAGKNIIYWSKKHSTWKYPAEYGDEVEAWERVRAGFVQAFDSARGDGVAYVDAIDELRTGFAITTKAISCYVPGALIPITNKAHLHACVFRLSGKDASNLDPFAAHELLKQLVDEDERFAGWQPYEVAWFLDEWATASPDPTILMVAPGEKGRYWNDCLEGGYMCVGWDEVGELTRFASEEEFRAGFEAADPHGHKSTNSVKANELWRFLQLRPGDRVIANRGHKEILGVGTVTSEGYRWRPDRPEYFNTVSVDWDTGYAQTLPVSQQLSGQKTVRDVQADLWQTIQSGGRGSTPEAEMVIPDDPLFDQLSDLLARKGQVILYGPPGTGKTYASLRFALRWLGTRQEPVNGVEPLAKYGTTEFRQSLNALHEAGYLTQVTFHPAYGYEDFIEGFRPDEGADGGLRLVLRDGIFKRVCKAAEANPKQPYLLLIDEINRGDIPKILGELITLLEPDKRGMHVMLPSGWPFAVPSNVHILGTMNTADRSIRLLDSALRRRFAFHELLPDTGVLDGQKVGAVDLGLLLRELNGRVVKELGRERQIGHSFFLSGAEPVDSEAELAAVIRTEVLPLLQEYAYDDYSMLSRFLGERIVDVQAHTVAGLSDEQLVEALSAELQANAGD